MKTKTNFNLNNDYYLKIINNDDLPISAIAIEHLKIFKIIKSKQLILKIDFNNFSTNQYKKILRKLLFIKNKLKRTKINFGIQDNSKILLGYLINYNENDRQQNDFISGINAIFYNTRYERYNYIYDQACNYLDSYFYGKNLCDFKDNKCGEKRNTKSTIGCCRHYKIKWLGPFSKFVPCEHLSDDYTCGAKCISCKLFTCDYLRNKGVKFKIKDILLLDTFFNPLQKYFIKYMVYTPKEKIIRRLMIL